MNEFGHDSDVIYCELFRPNKSLMKSAVFNLVISTSTLCMLMCLVTSQLHDHATPRIRVIDGN